MPLRKPKHILVQEELERRILHGLACEWENTIWCLETSHENNLSKPLFSLRDMKSRWGYWSGEKNEICLSRDLVLNHSWSAVREILLHEMAHQFAEQVLCAHDEPPHGPKFRSACRSLRANPEASGNYRPLDERIAKDSADPEDRILVRVKKLMALAQSRNQHEAEAAMTKAHELIAKYNVDLLSRDNNRHFVSIFVGRPALRHFREEYHLSGLLQEFYFVYGIWVPAYVIEKRRMGRVLEISGTAQNVRIASYIHDFIWQFIDSQWQDYNKKKGLNRYRKTDFAAGIIEGFRSKLKRQTEAEKVTGSKHGLIQIRDPLLQEHVKYKYPRTAGIRGRALRNDRHVLRDGIEVGKELIIHKGISKKGSGRKLLVTPQVERLKS